MRIGKRSRGIRGPAPRVPRRFESSTSRRPVCLLWIASHSGWFNSVLRAVAFHVTQLLSFSCSLSSLSLQAPPSPLLRQGKYYKSSSRLFILSLSLLCSSISIPPIFELPFFALLLLLLRFLVYFSFSLFRRVMLVAGGKWRKVEVKRRWRRWWWWWWWKEWEEEEEEEVVVVVDCPLY